MPRLKMLPHDAHGITILLTSREINRLKIVAERTAVHTYSDAIRQLIREDLEREAAAQHSQKVAA